MLKLRVIPVLLLKKNGLVKTTKFKKGKYLGDPINIVKIFNEKEVDELVILDILASQENKEPNYSLIEDIASECFMPFAYGGGIKNFEQIKRIFSLGVEKVIINTRLDGDNFFLQKAVDFFGSQSIVASVDIKKNFFGRYGIYKHKKNKIITTDVEKYVKSLEKLGVGEIFFNDVDRDGTREGYNLDLMQQLNCMTTLPTVYCGGADSINDIRAASTKGATSLAAGSMFVLRGEHRAVLISYPMYEDLEKLNEELSCDKRISDL